MSTAPDYGALVRLLLVLRNLVDTCGQVMLTAEEAEQIRLLGFRAEEGRWKVPPVPPELVCDNPLLEHLSIGWNPAQAAATPSGANSKNESCEAAQIIEGNTQPVPAASKADGIHPPIEGDERKADPHATAAKISRITPTISKVCRRNRARTLRQKDRRTSLFIPNDFKLLASAPGST